MSALLQTLGWFAAFTGAAIPAFSSFFRAYVPPLFPEVGYFLAALGAAILVVVLIRKVPGSRLGVIAIAIATIILAGYLVGLRQWTVVDLHDEQIRYQVGTATTENVLTKTGQLLIAADPDATPKELMLQAGAFEQDGPRRIWTGASILTAGTILLMLYLLGFAAWTFGFASLARSLNHATRRTGGLLR